MPLHEYLEQKRRQNIAALNASGACHICGSTGRDSRGFSHFIDSEGAARPSAHAGAADIINGGAYAPRRGSHAGAAILGTGDGEEGCYNENSMVPRPQLAAMRTCACFGQSPEDPNYWPYSLRVCDKCIEDDAGIGRIRNCGICGTVACDENCGTDGAELLECTDCSEWNNAGCLECRRLGDFSEIPLFRKHNVHEGSSNVGVNGGWIDANTGGGEPRMTRVCARCLEASTPWIKHDFVCRRFRCETRLVPSAIVERKRHCRFGSSPLNLLPEDGLVAVVDFLTSKDLKQLFLTCSAMCTVAERVSKEKTERVSHLYPPGPLTVTIRKDVNGQTKEWTRLDGSAEHNFSAPEDVKAWVGVYHFLEKITKEMYYFGPDPDPNATERFINSDEERFEFGQTYTKLGDDTLFPVRCDADDFSGYVIRGGCVSIREGDQHHSQLPLTIAANKALVTGRHHIICRLFCPGSGGARSNRDANNNKLGSIGIIRTNQSDGQASWAQRVDVAEAWLTEDVIFGLDYNADTRELIVHSNPHANRLSRFAPSRYTLTEGEGDLRIGLELTGKSAAVPFTLLSARSCTEEEWGLFVDHTRNTNPGGVMIDRAAAAVDLVGLPLGALAGNDAFDADTDEGEDDAAEGGDVAANAGGDDRAAGQRQFMRQRIQRAARVRLPRRNNAENNGDVPPPLVARGEAAANRNAARGPTRRVVRALRPYARGEALPERMNNGGNAAERETNADARVSAAILLNRMRNHYGNAAEGQANEDVDVQMGQWMGAPRPQNALQLVDLMNQNEEIVAGELVQQVEMEDASQGENPNPLSNA